MTASLRVRYSAGMRALTRPIALVLAVVLAGACRPSIPPPALGQSFQLGPGQSVSVQGERIEVGFKRVVSDSRCPDGVQCITAGEAVVSLWAREQGSAERNTFESRVAGGMHGPDSTAAQAEFQNWRIQVLQLQPYPKAGAAADSTRYLATLRVTSR